MAQQTENCDLTRGKKAKEAKECAWSKESRLMLMTVMYQIAMEKMIPRFNRLKCGLGVERECLTK